MLTWLKLALQHWKTSSSGLVVIFGSIIHLVFAIKDKTANENTYTITLTAILTGIGLIAAGDASQSATKQEVADAIATGDTSRLSKPPGPPTTTKGTP